MKKPYILFVILLLVGGKVFSAEKSDNIGEVRSAYARMDYEKAEELALAKLENEKDLTPAELVEIHEILAIIYYSQNSPLKAKQAFQSALSLEPNLELDPVMVSPKILEFFATVKADYRDKRESTNAMSMQYVRVYDPRPGAALRSLVLPGWGQMHKGERRKGIALMSLWALSASATIATSVMRSNAEDDYLAATSLPEINSKYRTFNRIHKVHQGVYVLAAITWGYAFFDALILESPSRRFAFGLSSFQDSLRMNFRLAF